MTVKKPLQRFQLMNEICYGKVMEAAGKHQVLIFVHSRKETAKTARFLKEECLKNDTLARIMRDDSASREILQVRCGAVRCGAVRCGGVGWGGRAYVWGGALGRGCASGLGFMQSVPMAPRHHAAAPSALPPPLHCTADRGGGCEER